MLVISLVLERYTWLEDYKKRSRIKNKSTKYQFSKLIAVNWKILAGVSDKHTHTHTHSILYNIKFGYSYS